MDALYKLVAYQQQWQVAITHIQSLADGDAVDQLFYKEVYSVWTPIMRACVRSGPLVLVQRMITKAQLDSSKRYLLAITDGGGFTALHFAAYHCDPAVLELLIREHPLALCSINGYGFTPLQHATAFNRLAHISLLTDTTNALAERNFAALAARVHGDER